MSPEKFGTVGDIVLLGAEDGRGTPQEAVIIGHTTRGDPEFMPSAALASPSEVVRYLGAQRGGQFVRIAETLELMKPSSK